MSSLEQAHMIMPFSIFYFQKKYLFEIIVIQEGKNHFFQKK